MLNLNIGSQIAYSAFWQILSEALPDLCNYNVKMQIQKQRIQAPISVCFVLDTSEESILPKGNCHEKVNAILARVVAKYILGYQSWQWLSKKVKKACPDLNSEECLQIVYAASQWLHGVSNGEYDLMTGRLNHRLYQSLYEFISENDYLDIDGFSRFRLTDYYAKLEEALEISIEEFYWQHEYEELVAVLKEFLSTQREIVKVLHVLMRENGDFVLLDEAKNLVRDENGERVMVDGVFNLYDDVLIGSILALAPAKVILHHKHGLNLHFTELLEDVLGERLSFCNGCDVCQKEYKSK